MVDAGRVKQLSYDPATRMTSLDDVRVSSAAAKQRRGRAGRVAEGLCVHIYPSDERLDAYTEPEVRRTRYLVTTPLLRAPSPRQRDFWRAPVTWLSPLTLAGATCAARAARDAS